MHRGGGGGFRGPPGGEPSYPAQPDAYWLGFRCFDSKRSFKEQMPTGGIDDSFLVPPQ